MIAYLFVPHRNDDILSSVTYNQKLESIIKVKYLIVIFIPLLLFACGKKNSKELWRSYVEECEIDKSEKKTIESYTPDYLLNIRNEISKSIEIPEDYNELLSIFKKE